jgi:hypothetical protein
VSGRKTFVAGEILTASDVNGFLMDQSVMVFDDSTARASAIPTPSEGMVTYLKDTDAVEKFTGSSFVPVGGLVATKQALKTDTFTASVTSGGEVAVTGLSITHAMQNANNKLIISAYFGAAGNTEGFGQVGLSVADGSTLLALGDAAGTRTRVTAGGRTSSTADSQTVGMPSVTFIYQPGDTTSRTYTVRAINIVNGTRTLFINRTETDGEDPRRPRSSSALVIQEVAV